MKLLLTASFPDSLINFRGPLIAALLERGIEVHVAAPDLPPHSPVRRALEAMAVQVHDIPLQRTGLNPVADLRLLWTLTSLVRRIKPDKVLAYTIKPVVYGLLAARLAGVPGRFALITGLGYAFTGEPGAKSGRGILRGLVQRLYRMALAGASRVFFQNPDDEALFRRRGLLPTAVPSTVVNGSGINVAAFAPAPLPSAPRFLLIARLLGDKGVREYAEAARCLKREHPGVNCSLVGWIDANPDAIREDELDRWVREGGLDYLGRLDDVRPAIADCSVYVLPSYREGTPRTVLEAMAMGRAIITTDAPGCRETVVDGRNGLLVPLKSSQALLAAMRRFVEEPGLAGRMGVESRRLAEEKYDVNKVNAAMLSAMGLA